MAKVKITTQVSDLLAPFLEENGLELYDVEFVKEGRDWFLRVYIDKDDYVDTDDCELVSRFLSEKLDEEDPIEQNYYLEVSSPGMDRAIRNEAEYQKYSGRVVDVKLYSQVDGQKEFQGTLKGLVDGQVIIEDEKGSHSFPLEAISKTKLAVLF
ncbi:MAG: ribosome maturation factor RimP [Clostridia bacterium]|nr:ribosome maturation factor RimP [Clostridia bacterium]